MKRLSRLEMVFTEAPVYFITTCTEKRRPLLANHDTHEIFRCFCMLARERGVLVGRYVLMPDHLHLFVCIPPGGGGVVDVDEIAEKHDFQTLAGAWDRSSALAEGGLRSLDTFQ